MYRSEKCLFPPVNIVWFKRDLRVKDHRVLAQASLSAAVLPLFVVEDELWHQPDMSARHWEFVQDCLIDLRSALHQLGQPLVVRRGKVIDVLAHLQADYKISGLYSHEETGNAWTFKRDQKVAAWCAQNAILWYQTQQHGTQRRLTSRNGWSKSWDSYMAQPLTSAPILEPILDLSVGAIPTVADLGLSPDLCAQRQKGGRENGLERLNSFLYQRGEYYRTEMSNPLNGSTACSRISPHLAWGTVSVREVSHKIQQRQQELKNQPKQTTGRWPGALSSFSGRLHWHCHFIQKLEDEPRIEYSNLHRAYDGLRLPEPESGRLKAWTNGETGLPFVDACMRSLATTGWLNFRMRAMLTAVASYHLWLDWKQPGNHLARHFTDYEPGIHWPQIQMQSGTTGINTIRIYNPIKQGYDQDPDGRFVRSWLPELAQIEDAFLHEPWKAPNARSILGKAYPEPIVDHHLAAKCAKDKIWGIRAQSDFRSTAKAINNKHGSRKSGIPMLGRQKNKNCPTDQLSFKFEEKNAE